jgi:hypothetical protein
MWEGYLLGIPNAAESALRREMQAACGAEETSIFFDSIVEHLIGPADLACVKSLGMNVVRLPFHHRWVEADGGSLIARAVEWAAAEDVYVILDMHAAPGGQNGSWHSDTTGESGLWASDANIEEFLRLWRILAERYRDEPAVAGYDVMNEPILTDKELPRQDEVYRRVVDAIRAIDDRHIIILEEDQDRKSFDNFSHQYGDNICYSYHTYSQPHETEARREAYRGIIKANRVPLYCGEHDIWNLLDEFRRETVHWTWWPYLRSSADLWGHPMVLAGGDEWKTFIRATRDALAAYVNQLRDVFSSADLPPDCRQELLSGLDTQAHNIVFDRRLHQVLNRFPEADRAPVVNAVNDLGIKAFADAAAETPEEDIRNTAASLASREETEYADRLKRAIAEGQVS